MTQLARCGQVWHSSKWQGRATLTFERRWGSMGKGRGQPRASPPGWTRASAPKAVQEASADGVGLPGMAPSSCTDLCLCKGSGNPAMVLLLWLLGNYMQKAHMDKTRDAINLAFLHTLPCSTQKLFSKEDGSVYKNARTKKNNFATTWAVEIFPK